MTNEEAALLPPGVYRMLYHNGKQDLAAVGEIVGGGRWYMSVATITSGRHPRCPWDSWEHVRTAELILTPEDLTRIDDGTLTSENA